MRRQQTSTRFPAVLGLAVALQFLFASTCSAGICWHWGTVGATPLSPFTPMVSMGAVQPFAVVSPGAVSALPSVQPHAMPGAPVLNPIAPVAPTAASGYTPYTYGYYTYGSSSSVAPIAPVAPTAFGGVTPLAPQTGSLPVSPYQHLAGYDPDAPISPLTPGGVVTALSTAVSLGDKILNLLSNTASANPGIASDKGNLLQTAINIFGTQTGAAPVIQDVMVLAKIADKVFKQLQAASGRGTPAAGQVNQAAAVASPTQVPAGTAATITITVTVQSSGQVSVNSQAGTAAGAGGAAAGGGAPAGAGGAAAGAGGAAAGAGGQPSAGGGVNAPGVVPDPRKNP